MLDLVITRHSALVQYLKDLGLIDDSIEVVTHATAELVSGKNVVGVLPHSLSCLTSSFMEVPLFVPSHLRGAELSLEQIKRFSRPAVTYKVTVI